MNNEEYNVYAQKYNSALYAGLEALTLHRLQGNEFSRTRPKTSMRLNIDEWNTVTFKPEIALSPRGWKMGDKIRLEHRKAVVFAGAKATGCYLILNLKKDGSIAPKKWKRDKAKTKAAFEMIKDFLNKLADDPAKIISKNSTHCVLCGRKFTDPDSMARGIGPECMKLFDFLVDHFGGGTVN